MEQRERTHVLSSVVEFDDAYLDGQKKGGKGGRETEKAKIFVTLSLNKRGDSQYQNEHYKKYQAGFRKTLCPRSHCAGDIPQADNWRFFTNGR